MQSSDFKNSNVFSKAFTRALPLLVSGALFFNGGVMVPISQAAEDFVPTKYEAVAPWNSAIKYTVVKKGDGAEIKSGDLVEVRFVGSFQGKVFDDTFSTAEPYYYRAGLGSILKGLDDTIIHMRVGDRFKVSFGGLELSFPNIIKSSPGKPRIPAGAEVEYEVECVNLPGTGDDFIADYE